MSALKTYPIIEEIPDPPLPAALFGSIKERPYSFFLDSSTVHERHGRYSFVGCDPFLVFRAKRDITELQWPDGRIERSIADPFTALKNILNRYSGGLVSRGLPFSCGAVGYFAYDLKDFIETLPDNSIDDTGLPDCLLGLYDSSVIYDHVIGKAYIASSGFPETDPGRRAARAHERIGFYKDKVNNCPPSRAEPEPRKDRPIRSNFSKKEYMNAVRAAKSYIRKGDIYQVNLSQRFQARFEADTYELYLRLRQLSPAPFSSYLGFEDLAILSSSPERFIMKEGRYIETRPIKGTRPRGGDPYSDGRLERELSASAKDMAEHIMIVDLERNDLGRICVYGSIKHEESAVIERYANVFHLVSTVTGHLKEGVDAVDCLKAAFPGGSITGAPKIRAMEIIDELEGVKRSVYTGSIGYISFDGDMDTSIVIRTLIVKDKEAYFSVGGGIVADSDPEKEYEETLHKAKGILTALGTGSMESVASGHMRGKGSI